MLGRKIDVKVVSSIPYAGLYNGYYMSGNRRKNIYLLSKEHPRDHVRCTVIAIAQSRNSTQTKLIAATIKQHQAMTRSSFTVSDVNTCPRFKRPMSCHSSHRAAQAGTLQA